eukprot:CAMPEP_0113936046 /NCGR_PEP_ID=MMETSP1339-20121228/3042_1 /TAXON_ID=94617 /ORGANISM="Fibrocapsa japonica" /LENGTH=543 /DNA_ID=CAMNT_0000938383 /DNA_START=238 /DNA_END=1870 /DNA_ORIENTATION=- /assembly_acc=CAM_ASM_000762
MHLLEQRERETVQYKGAVEFACVVFSKASAFAMYAPTIAVFVSKCKALVSFARSTPLRMWLSMDRFDEHDFHVFCGKLICFEALVHTIFHFIRWGLQGKLMFIFSTRTGSTGLLAFIILLLISVPMTLLRAKICYEVRKALHWMFIPFAICLAWHAPSDVSWIAHVLSFCIVIYCLDSFYVWTFRTEFVKTTHFTVLDCGVQVSMPVSSAMVDRTVLGGGGFAYLCIPWISKYEWHPFSIYDDPEDPNKRNIFIYKAGNWSKALHNSLRVNTTCPVWLQGPFHSPFGSAVEYDNQILVATGIGITPAICTINALKADKKISLIWMTHEPELVEFYLERHALSNDSFNIICYTGKRLNKRKLNPAIVANAGNVKILEGRVDLHELIPKIVCNLEQLSYEKSENNHSGDKLLAKKHSFIRQHSYTLPKRTLTWPKMPLPPPSAQGITSPIHEEMKEGDDEIGPHDFLPDIEAPRVMEFFTTAEDSKLYVSEMTQDRLKKWSVLYCGACEPVHRALVDNPNNMEFVAMLKASSGEPMYAPVGSCGM